MALYFMQCGDGGPVKIGFSRAVEKRVAAIQLASPYQITLLASAVVARCEEKRLHHVLGRHWLRGEWFTPHPEVMAAMEATKSVTDSNFIPFPSEEV